MLRNAPLVFMTMPFVQAYSFEAVLKDGLSVFQNSRPYAVKASKLSGLKFFSDFCLLLAYILAIEQERLILSEKAARYAVIVPLSYLLLTEVSIDYRGARIVKSRVDHVIQAGYRELIRYLRAEVVYYQQIAVKIPLRLRFRRVIIAPSEPLELKV